MIVLWLAAGILAGASEAPPEPPIVQPAPTTAGRAPRSTMMLIRRVEKAAEAASGSDYAEAERLANDAARFAETEAERSEREDREELERIAVEIRDAASRARRAYEADGMRRLEALLVYPNLLKELWAVLARTNEDEEAACLAILMLQ